ncbi:substrate-binding periplasmic protein [Balneatrix alpica]|uniref:Substrate-binding periplasmic protein n=1 Tax=Balneatrix alpica TaxID=75684 RepID=A0ABV5ZAQ8_9GAMM|nr:transporter substrate-binding domain-containing protein [Balneatrix alpica]
MKLLVVMGLLLPTWVFASCERLNLLYHERPPYQFRGPLGDMQGILVAPLQKALNAAHLPYQWTLTPAKRQLEQIKENQDCSCGLGWFKNPSREGFARFSLYLYQDQAQIALARANTDQLKPNMRVEAALASSLRLGLRDGYSYGHFLDQLMEQLHPPRDSTATSNEQMLRKLQSGRIDYFFIAPEEASELLNRLQLSPSEFEFVYFSNMPSGEKRYLMCTQQLETVWMERLNQAIRAHVHPDYPLEE